MKRKGLRRVSARRKKVLEETTGPRREYVANSGGCQCCLRHPAHDCHEILQGPLREQALYKRSCWLALCRECHDAMHDKSIWPVERQLALKLLADPNFFNLAEVNEIRKRRSLTYEDIVVWLTLRDFGGRRSSSRPAP